MFSAQMLQHGLDKGLDFLQSVTNLYFSLIPRPLPEQRELANIRLIAHRGAHQAARGILENTYPAFERAMDLSCWGVELDIRETKDEALLVHHDPTLQRLWKFNQTIRESSLQSLQELIPELPTLNDIVRLYGKKMHLFIELKTPFAAETSLVEALRPLTPSVDYHLLSLEPSIFQQLTTFDPACCLLVASHHNVKRYAQLCLDEGYGGLLGHYVLMTNKVIKRIRSHHKVVGVGFLESKYSLYREINRNIPWLFTDNAELIASCLQDLTAHKP